MTVIGNNSLSRSTIISGTMYDNLTINLNGSNFDNNYVHCNQGVTCTIHCLSQLACTNLHLYCYGKCYVECGELNNINCPLSIYGNYTTIEHIRLT